MQAFLALAVNFIPHISYFNSPLLVGGDLGYLTLSKKLAPPLPCSPTIMPSKS